MSGVPKDIDQALGAIVVTKSNQGQARLIAYTDQPTVTIEFPDGSRQHIVESVFRQGWRIPKSPSEESIARAASAVRRAGLHTKLNDTALQNLIVETMARELEDQLDELP